MLLLVETTGLDIYLQDILWNSFRRGWMVDAQSYWPRLIFYRLPRLTLFIAGAIAAIAWLSSFRADRRL